MQKSYVQTLSAAFEKRETRFMAVISLITKGAILVNSMGVVLINQGDCSFINLSCFDKERKKISRNLRKSHRY